MQRHNIHGTGIVLDEIGLILRGPSGAGKSLLALLLLDFWSDRGRPALLVADDRLDLLAEGGAITMHAPRSIEGLIELRGRGIVRRPFVSSAGVGLLVDLVDRFDRMPEEDEQSAELLGVHLPRCPVPRLGLVETSHQMLLIRESFRSLQVNNGVLRQKTT